MAHHGRADRGILLTGKDPYANRSQRQLAIIRNALQGNTTHCVKFALKYSSDVCF